MCAKLVRFAVQQACFLFGTIEDNNGKFLDASWRYAFMNQYCFSHLGFLIERGALKIGESFSSL